MLNTILHIPLLKDINCHYFTNCLLLSTLVVIYGAVILVFEHGTNILFIIVHGITIYLTNTLD